MTTANQVTLIKKAAELGLTRWTGGFVESGYSDVDLPSDIPHWFFSMLFGRCFSSNKCSTEWHIDYKGKFFSIYDYYGDKWHIGTSLNKELVDEFKKDMLSLYENFIQYTA